MLKVEIITHGCIDEEWAEWLGGLSVTHPEQEQTVLSGVLPDQAALYGVIARLRDLGLPLASVRIDDVEQDDA